MHSINVNHTVQVAHRLMNLPGKCQAIHGHSMRIEIELIGDLNENGILEGVDFAELKKDFRGMLDAKFDHHLVLNQDDPAATVLWGVVPGITEVPGDPTVENLARWIANTCVTSYHWGRLVSMVSIEETDSNGAIYVLQEDTNG